MNKTLFQKKLGRITRICVALCLTATVLSGCSTAETPFDYDRGAADELPATAETFSADPDTSRKLSSHNGFEFYAAQARASSDNAGQTCVLIVDSAQIATESCGQGPIIDIAVTGVRVQYHLDGKAEELDGWEKLTPNLLVKEF